MAIGQDFKPLNLAAEVPAGIAGGIPKLTTEAPKGAVSFAEKAGKKVDKALNTGFNAASPITQGGFGLPKAGVDAAKQNFFGKAASLLGKHKIKVGIGAVAAAAVATVVFNGKNKEAQLDRRTQEASTGQSR